MSERLALPGSPAAPQSTVVTVGTFDGVHRGHLAVLNCLLDSSAQHGLRSVVVTFQPHPLRVLRPEAAPRMLCTAEEKVELLRASGVDQVAIVPFTTELAGYSPRRFLEEVLITHFGMRHLVIGYDHGFGKDRSGDAATLQSLDQELGYQVTVVPDTELDDRPISSTRIRSLLTEGDVLAAARALGRPYSFDGQVARGDGRGRELGFPTANLGTVDQEKLLPAEGIYAVHVRVDQNHPAMRGLLHLGPRPTFGSTHPTAEVYLLDYQGDLYGRQLRVSLCSRIRGVERFATVQELIDAMHGDVAAARQIFSTGQDACA
ncbi:MAG: bifunctional riboflavin kinase/FAD synthetase [Pseudomonas sp.]